MRTLFSWKLWLINDYFISTIKCLESLTHWLSQLLIWIFQYVILITLYCLKFLELLAWYSVTIDAITLVDPQHISAMKPKSHEFFNNFLIQPFFLQIPYQSFQIQLLISPSFFNFQYLTLQSESNQQYLRMLLCIRDLKTLFRIVDRPSSQVISFLSLNLHP